MNARAYEFENDYQYHFDNITMISPQYHHISHINKTYNKAYNYKYSLYPYYIHNKSYKHIKNIQQVNNIHFS